MSDREEQIDDLLVDWEASRLAGREMTPVEVCARSPELLEQVTEKIAVLKELSWVTDPNAVIESQSDMTPVDETVLPDTDVTVEEFLQTLSQSGALSGKKLKRVQDYLTAGPAERAVEMARKLVADGIVTPYQAKVVLERGDSPLLLDRYIILDSIGAGGMGIVFKALQKSLERVVAVKVLPRHAVDSPEKVERFQREMRAAARISHPNVVQAFDAHESNGVYFFAMEYVDGSDLAKLVDDSGPLPVEQAVSVISQAAAGLASAHANGIVHRDVKPSNILLANDGTAKVLDLGLARTRELVQSTTVNDLTKDGLAMGTVAYMSPEQAFDARQADVQSDIYSLGCTLYFLLHGKPIFERANSVQTVVAHRETPAPQLGAGLVDVPPFLAESFQRMVAKDPQDRPNSMEEVAELMSSVSGVESTARVRADSNSERSNVSSDVNEPTTIDRSGRSASLRWIAVAGICSVIGLALWLNPLAPNSDSTERAMRLLNDYEVDLTIETSDAIMYVTAGDELPSSEFEITGALLWPDQLDQLADVALIVPQLDQLTISSAEETTEVELQGLEAFGDLSDLTLTGLSLSKANIDRICKGLPKLASLQLCDCDGPIGEFAQVHDLRNLVISEMSLDDDEAAWLGSMRGLQFLDLSNTDTTCSVLLHLVDLPELEQITLTGIDINDDLKLLGSFPALNDICLSATNLLDSHVSFLATVSSLTALDVSHTKLTPTGVSEIAGFAGLSELYLDGLDIRASCDEIARLASLEVLSVESTDFDDACLEKLSQSDQLSALHAGNTSLTQAAIKRFELRSPNCFVFTDESDGWSMEQGAIE